MGLRVCIFVLSLLIVYSASFKLWDVGSSLSTMWADHELKLQDVIQNSILNEENNANRHHRSIRSSSIWTGFVPQLYQRRDQLEIKSIEIFQPGLVCSLQDTSQKVLVDSIHFKQSHYTLAACGNRLSLYGVDLSSFFLLDSMVTSSSPVSISHVKMFDSISGVLQLIIMVLTSSSIHMYTIKEGKIEFLYNQELANVYHDLKVFHMDGDIYCILTKKSSGDSKSTVLYKVDVVSQKVTFRLIASEFINDSTQIRVCSVNDRVFLLQPSVNLKQLNVFLIENNMQKYHQSLSAASIQDFDCFRVGLKDFIVVVNPSSIIFYGYNSGYFEVAQSIEQNGSKTVKAFETPTYNNEAIIIIRRAIQSYQTTTYLFSILVHDSLTFQFIPIPYNCQAAIWTRAPFKFDSKNLGCFDGIAFVDLRSSSALHVNQSLVTFLPSDGRLWMVKIETLLKPLENPILQEVQATKKRTDAAASSANAIEARSRDFLEFSKGIVLYGGDIKLEGSWNVTTLVAPSLEIDTVAADNVQFNQNLWIPQLDKVIEQLEHKLEALENTVGALDRKLQGAILNGTQESLQLDELVVNGELVVHKLTTVQMSLERIDEKMFSDLIKDFVRKDSIHLIRALEILGTLTTNSLESSFINNIPVGNILHDRNGSIEVEGDVIVRDDVHILGDLSVNGTVNNLNLSRQLVTSSSQIASFIFNDSIYTNNLNTGEFINNMNISYFLSNILMSDAEAPQFNDVMFDKLFVEGDLETSSGIVEGVNLTYLNTSVLRLNADDVMDSNLEFDEAMMEGDLIVTSVNDIDFQDIILKSHDFSNLILKGEKKFLTEVNAGSVAVETINGHSIKNVFTLDTDQIISTPVNFSEGFEVRNSDLTVESVNSLSWKNVREKGLHPTILELEGVERDVRIQNSCQIKGTLTTNLLQVGEESLSSILDDIIYENEEHVVITGQKKLSSLRTNRLYLDGLINGKILLDEILTTTTDQTIGGHYELRGDVVFTDLEVKGKLNDYDLKELLDNVLRVDAMNEKFECNLQFSNLTVNNQIQVLEGTINGISRNEMLLAGEDQTFTVPQTLMTPTFKKLLINRNLKLEDSSTLINNKDLDLFESKRATVSTDQWINANWQLDQANMSSLSLRTLNALTMDQWHENYMQKYSSTPQVLKGKEITIGELKISGNITTEMKNVIGFDWRALERDAGDIRRKLSFNTNVVFEHLETEKLELSGNFNNVSISDLAMDAIFHDSNQTIKGIKTFQTAVKVDGDVLTELVNNVRLIDTYLHKTVDQLIIAPVRVTGKMVISDLELEGKEATLNGVPNDLIFSSHTLPYNVHLGNMTFEESIEIDSLYIGSLLNENWEKLVASIAYINQPNAFKERIHFHNLVKFNGNLSAEHVNGVNLSEFVEDVVFKDISAIISGKKTFNTVEAHNLKTGKTMAEAVYPDIVTTWNSAVHFDYMKPIKGAFYLSKLHVAGSLTSDYNNGCKFPDEYLSLNDDQYITRTVTLNRLIMQGNVTLANGAYINGFDIETECANTWMIDGGELVKSTKTFKGNVQFLDSIIVNTKVNEIFNLSQEVVKLREGGTIHGVPEWSDVIVTGDVHGIGLTNDVNLAVLANEALYFDTQIETNAKWTSKKAIIHKDLLLPVEASLNSESLRVGQLLGHKERTLLRSLKVDDLKTYYAALTWHNALRSAYFKLEYFDLNQTLNISHHVTAIQEVNLNETSLLFIGTHNGSVIFRRNKNETSYTLAEIQPNMGHIEEWILVSHDRIASISLEETKLWQILSLDPLFIKQITNYLSSDIKLKARELEPQLDLNSEIGRKIVDASNRQSILDIKDISVAYTPERANYESKVKVHHFRLGSKSMIALVMAFSQEDTGQIIGYPGVQIYSIEAGRIRFEYFIRAFDVRALTSFSHGNFPDHYLLLAKRDGVTVYHYEGASGFIERSTLSHKAASAVSSWNVGNGYDSETLVAVGEADRVMIYKAVTIGDYIRS